MAHSPDTINRAQQFANNKLTIKQLEDDNTDLKYQLLPDLMADGPIQCVGGTVSARDAQEPATLNQERLLAVLMQQFSLTEEKAQAIIDSAKEHGLKLQTVVFRADP